MHNPLQESLKNFEKNLNEIISRDIDILKKTSSKKAIYDFKESKEKYYITQYTNSYSKLRNSLLELSKNKKISLKDLNELNNLIKNLEISFQTNDFNGIKKQLLLVSLLPSPKSEKFDFNPKNLPTNIRSEIEIDIKELEKCFFNDCYRSSVIICGRLLETALHSKYYEETGFDLLEKNPGIGLGNLIAKLKEKDIKLPPSINEQIHLINNVRTFSVHKKKDIFYPSRQQVYAIILFTLDILEKLFS